METAVSSSVSCTAIRVSTVLSSREAHHLRCNNYPTTPHLNLSSAVAPAANLKLNPNHSSASASANPTSSSHQQHHQLLTSSSSRRPSAVLPVHRNAATGYAAALIDVSQCSGSLQQVQQDVRRLSRIMLQDSQIQGILTGPAYSYHYKGLILKEIGKKLKFHKHLAALLRMLIDKEEDGIDD